MAKGGSIKCERCGAWINVYRYDNPDRVCECGWQPDDWSKSQGRVENGELVISNGYRLRDVLKRLGFRFDAGTKEWRGAWTDQVKETLKFAISVKED